MSASRVGVVTVTYNGLDHLRSFVPALQRNTQDYAQGIRLLVVDNASTDGTEEWLKSQSIEYLPLKENCGFAKPNNIGVAHLADCQYVALLNNDTEVQPLWLEPLLETLENDPEIVAAGSVLLDWSGEKLDFAGGEVSFSGHAHHKNQGQPLSELEEASREVLFLCGGAMLVRKELYLGLGGFDEDFFAYFEDIDLGWRSWLAGYKMVLVPRSRVHHRHQGTAKRLPFPPRMRLYERNALCTILKNYSEGHLWTALAASLWAVFARASAYSSFDYSGFLPSDPLPETPPPEGHYPISDLSAAQLLALEDMAENWELWMGKRAAIQAMRRRDDRDILPLFGDYAIPPLLGDKNYAIAHKIIMKAMGIEHLGFGGEP